MLSMFTNNWKIKLEMSNKKYLENPKVIDN